tara:strand:- start:7486 stop:7878 length:393 start_codon:yes stop_codon:yes gene_type:complete
MHMNLLTNNPSIFKYRFGNFLSVIVKSMDHQDWNTVTIYKRNTFKKSSVNKSKEQKLEETELGDVPKVKRSVAKLIQTGRVARGFKTQKDLANAIGVQTSVISSYESGKAIPDHILLQKLRRVLQIKLPA